MYYWSGQADVYTLNPPCNNVRPMPRVPEVLHVAIACFGLNMYVMDVARHEGSDDTRPVRPAGKWEREVHLAQRRMGSELAASLFYSGVVLYVREECKNR